MKAYKIECQGEIHEIGIDRDGGVHLLNHDIEEEETLCLLGEKPSECFRIVHSSGEVLVEAIAARDIGIVDLAMAVGADLGEKCGMDMFGARRVHPLTLAASKGFVDIVSMLLQAGANPKADDSCALRLAAEGLNGPGIDELDHAGVVRLLLEAGADVDACGGQALTNAVKFDNREIVKVLINAGAEIDISSGTALAVAAQMRRTDVVRMLLEQGVNPANIKAACDWAQGCSEIISMLEDALNATQTEEA